MTFLHTSLFLAGIACVSIPILIHLLLRQRRKPIAWAAMRFLMEAYRKQRRRMKLQHLLLLLARCMALLFLAAALARPALNAAGFGGAGGRSVYVLVDNSLTASARLGGSGAGIGGAGEMALERHKRTASALIASLGPADRVGLIALAGPADPLVVPASSNVASVENLVNELRPTDSAMDLPGALERIAAQIKSEDEESQGGGVVVAVLSDFLQGSADTTRALPSALAELPGLTVLASPPALAGGGSAGNTQIISVEPLRPIVLTGGAGMSGQREQVRVSLRRSGATVADAAVTSLRVRFISAEGAARLAPESRISVSWAPGQSETTVAVDVEAPGRDAAESSGVSSALIAEIDRDAVAGDNILRRPIGVREALRAGIIARRRFTGARTVESLSPAEWLALALRPVASSPIDVIELDPQAVDAPALAALDVVFAPAPDQLSDDAWSRLRRFVDSGGLLVVSPPAEATMHIWTDVMVKELGLGWRIAREPVRFEGESATGGGGMALDDKPEASPILSLVAAEIPALTRPVRVYRALPVEELARGSETLLRLANGTPWLVQGSPGDEDAEAPASSERATPREGPRGLVLYMASAPTLGWTDLPAKPLMVPLIQEITRQGFGRAMGSWSTIAGRAIETPQRTARLMPTPERAALEDQAERSPIIISGARGQLPIPRSAGLWSAVDEAGRSRGMLAINANPDAGRLNPSEATTLRTWLAGAIGGGGADDGLTTDDGGTRTDTSAVEWLDLENPGAALARQTTRSPMSLPLLIAALVLVTLELLMARWFSYASIDRTSAKAPRSGGGVASGSDAAEGGLAA